MIFHVREIAGISGNAFPSCEGFSLSGKQYRGDQQLFEAILP